jgi:DNA-directed RNA polymerase subunit beta'
VETAFFRQEDTIPRGEFEAELNRTKRKGLVPPVAGPVLLGISQIPSFSKSFLASASFQKSTAVLADAALEGRTDTLESNAARVVTGKLVRVGTEYSGI